MPFTLAIVGRPNVGKSTLFNRLVGRRLALVDDQPGVTRDLREGAGRLGPLRFTVVDTAGIEEVTDASLPGRMRALTERAVDAADVCLFLIDARIGVTPVDRTLAELLRKRAARVILVANKAEGRAAEAGLIEAWELGLGEPVALSAEHGIGMDDLLRALEPVAEGFPDAAEVVDVEGGEAIDDAVDEEGEGAALPAGRPIQIAVVGRPNSGKSTLVNAILGEERLLTGPEAGITRDAIAVQLDWFGTPFRIFDTAGMRKKAKVQEKLEKLGVSDGLRAVKFAEVVVVLLDVQIPFESQDLRIADLAEREGRAVVVAVNKWDLEEEKSAKLNELREAFGRLLPQLRGRADGDGLGADRAGAGSAARGDCEGVFGLEYKDFYGEAQPVAQRADRRSSAAGAGGAAGPAAVYDAGQDPAADLRAVRLAARRGTGGL